MQICYSNDVLPQLTTSEKIDKIVF